MIRYWNSNIKLNMVMKNNSGNNAEIIPIISIYNRKDFAATGGDFY